MSQVSIAPSGDDRRDLTRTFYSELADLRRHGECPSTPVPGVVAVPSDQSLRLEASATGSGGRVFKDWAVPTGSHVHAHRWHHGLAICVDGENNGNGALKYEVTYVTPSAAAPPRLVTSGLNPSTYGTAVTLTASVTSSPTNPTAGTVTFRDGATVLCNAVALTGNQATCATPGLTAATLSFGAHSVTATYNPSGAFLTSTSAALTQQVNRRTLTGSFTANNKEYDGTIAATIASRSLSGRVVAGEVVTLTGGTATFANKNVGLGKTVTGINFSLGGTNAGNYQLASTTLTTTADIARHGLTVAFTAQDKTYDGTATATIIGRSLTGVLSGDTVTVSGGAALFGNKNTASGKQVTASGFVLGGTDAGNYTVTSVTPTTASIAPKSITGSFTAADKTYDRTTAASVTGRSLTGVVTGDDVSLSGGTATFGTSSAGLNKTVTLTGATLSGADKDNYSLSGVGTTTATIDPKTVTGSFTAAGKAYDGNNSATVTSRTVDGILTGDTVALSGGTATFANKNAGAGKAVTLTGAVLTGADKDNYSLGSVETATASIDAKSLTGQFTAADKTYDGDSSAIVLGRSLVGVVTGEVVTLTGGTATFADRHVGIDKTVTLSGAVLGGVGKDNYTLDSVESAQADINAKQITGSFTADDKPYDGTVDAAIASRSLTGVIGDDVVQLVGGTATFGSKTVGQNKSVTGTGFALDGAGAGDYVLQPTTLTTSASIAALGIVGHFTAANKDYDGTRAATVSSRTLSGVVTGDDVSLVGGEATFDTKDAGPNKTVTLTGGELIGEDAVNYALNDATLTTTATVSRRDLLISAENKSKVYGAAIPSFTGAIDGTQTGDAITLNFTTAADETSGVGTYAIVPQANAEAGVLDNYTVIPTNGTLTVTKAPLTITADDATKTYGDEVVFDGTEFSQVGLVNGDTVASVSLSSPGAAATATVAGGPYVIAISGASGTGLGNYDITYVAGELKVKAKALTITADDATKTYGDEVVFDGTEFSHGRAGQRRHRRLGELVESGGGRDRHGGRRPVCDRDLWGERHRTRQLRHHLCRR